MPAHEQLAAPLHATEQEPAHFVIRHVPASWQSSVHPPPVHSSVHVSALQSSTQPPASGQVMEHDDEPAHA